MSEDLVEEIASLSLTETATCKSKLKPQLDINCLPNEILEYIFSFLSVKDRILMESVCRRWRDLPWTWPNKLNIRTLKSECMKQHKSITDDILASHLGRCGITLKQLLLQLRKQGYWLTSCSLTIVANSCPNLRELRLDLNGQSKKMDMSHDFINLAEGCTKLKKLFIGYSDTLNDENLSLFLKHSTSLEYLTLVGNDAITANAFDTADKKLKGVNIQNCRRLVPGAVAERLINKCDNIVELGLGLPPLSTANLMVVLQCYKNTLKTLYLDHYAMDQLDWCEIPKLLQHLETLSLRHAVGVDDAMMKELAECCTKLETLDIGHTKTITDVGICDLARAPSLKLLNANSVSSITGQGVHRLATQGNLERFHFANITHVDPFIEESCRSLAICCKNFRFLDVTGNPNITNKLVEAFCSYMEQGLLNGPVSLYVGNTRVTKNVRCCDKLKLSFKVQRRLR